MERTVRFDSLAVGTAFTHNSLRHVKASARKADVTVGAEALSTGTVTFKPGDKVTIHLPDPTKEERDAERLRYVTRRLKGDIDAAESVLVDFKQRFEENAFDAFEWSGEKAIESAARKIVALQLAAFIESGGGLDEAIGFARGQVVRGARWGTRSTSEVVNVVARYKVQAYAEFVGYIEELG